MFLCRSSWSHTVVGDSRDPTVQLVVFVLGPGRRHSCPGADADSLGPVSIAFLQLQYIDKVVDVYCAGPAVLECTRGGDSRLLHLVEFFGPGRRHARCVQRQMPWSMTWRSSSTDMDVPVIMQRRLRQWKFPVVSSSPEVVDTFVRNRWSAWWRR